MPFCFSSLSYWNMSVLPKRLSEGNMASFHILDPIFGTYDFDDKMQPASDITFHIAPDFDVSIKLAYPLRRSGFHCTSRHDGSKIVGWYQTQIDWFLVLFEIIIPSENLECLILYSLAQILKRCICAVSYLVAFHQKVISHIIQSYSVNVTTHTMICRTSLATSIYNVLVYSFANK